MCGIAGVINLDGTPVDRDLLVGMAGQLIDRGPDDFGVWIDGSRGMAHTRLSIIDVAGSRQPMVGAGGRAHLVFNGEILNYRELRHELSYPFRTNGDSEVLLALYEKYGADGVDRLRGQFAYAVHDTATGETHLFRDRLGILPLYYFVNSRVFAFASEIKALLPVIGSPDVDEDSFHDYLAHRSVPAPYTLVKGVRKVPPGHRLTIGARWHGAIHRVLAAAGRTLKSVKSARARQCALSQKDSRIPCGMLWWPMCPSVRIFPAAWTAA